MKGKVHSINVSGSGGVPKLPIEQAFVKFEGVEGDFNRFRTERKNGDPRRAVSIFSMERILQLQEEGHPCLLYTSPSPRDATLSRMPSSA